MSLQLDCIVQSLGNYCEWFDSQHSRSAFFSSALAHAPNLARKWKQWLIRGLVRKSCSSNPSYSNSAGRFLRLTYLWRTKSSNKATKSSKPIVSHPDLAQWRVLHRTPGFNSLSTNCKERAFFFGSNQFWSRVFYFEETSPLELDTKQVTTSRLKSWGCPHCAV